MTGALSAAIVTSYTNVAVGFAVDFQAVIEGRVSASRWDFGDGVVVSNRPYASHAWSAAGDYVVELRAYNESHPEGVSAVVTIRVSPLVVYVSASSVNPVPPYGSWATAATNIQDAVDAGCGRGAGVGDQRRVSDRGAGGVWDEQPGGGDQAGDGAERQRAGGDEHCRLPGPRTARRRCGVCI